MVSKAEDRLAGKRSSSRDPVEVFEFQALLRPEDLYKMPKGSAIHEVAYTDDFIVAKLVSAKTEAYVIYDEHGSVIDPQITFPATALTLDKLAKEVAALGDKLDLRVRPSNAGGHVSFKKIASKLGIPETLHGHVAKLIGAKFRNRKVIDASAMQGNTEALYVPETSLVNIGDGKHIAFKSGDSLAIYRTVDENGGLLHPKEWECVEVENVHSIDKTLLAEKPFLNRFLPLVGGEQVGDSPYQASLKRGTLVLVNGETRKSVHSDAAAYAIIPNGSKSRLVYYNPESQQINVIDISNISEDVTPVSSIPLSISGEVEGIALDKQGNFVLVTVKGANGNELQVYDIETFTLHGSAPDIGGQISIDDLGNINFIDRNGRLRQANTNLRRLKPGAIKDLRAQQDAAITDLVSAIGTVRLPSLVDVEPKKEDPESPLVDPRLENAAEKVLERFGPDAEACNTVSDLSELSRRIEALAQSGEFSKYPGIFYLVDRLIGTRKENLQVSDFCRDLKALTERAKTVEEPEYILKVLASFEKARRTRKELVLEDGENREAVRQEIEKAESAVSTMVKDKSESLETYLAGQVKALQKEIIATASLAELESVSESDTCVALKEGLKLLPEETKGTELLETLETSLAQHQDKLDKEEAELTASQAFEQAKNLSQAKKLLTRMRFLIRTISDADRLQGWLDNDPVVTRFLEKLEGSPKTLAKQVRKDFEKLIQDKHTELASHSQVKIDQARGRVYFGKVWTPIFNPAVAIAPEVIPDGQNPSKGILAFVDSEGRRFTPDEDTHVPVNLNSKETLAAIRKHVKEAEDYFHAAMEKVPQFRAEWTYNKDIERKLAKFARLNNKQLRRRNKMTLLRGEAGTGKNVLVDIYSHFTNRPVFTFACNRRTEKEDLTFAYEFNPQEGTVRIDSKLIDALQTPGAVIVLDEINTLPEGVIKMLNSVMDYRRTLYLTDGREIEVHPNVILVGTMNPPHYIGTKKLPQEWKSRTRAMTVDYPAFQKLGGRGYYPYEAELLSKYMSSFDGIPQQAFYDMWDSVANGARGSGSDYMTRERKELINQLFRSVRCAETMRSAYRKYQAGRSHDPVEFVFTTRELIEIAEDINDGEGNDDLREIIRQVVLENLDTHEEYDVLSAIIDQV